MNEQGKPQGDTPGQPSSSADAAGDGLSSRRAFLAGVGRKTVYVTPVLLTLTATPAMASGFSASCKPKGQACTRNLSCCSNDCDTGGTNTCNCAPLGKPCTVDADCCSVSCGIGTPGLCD